MRQKAEPNKPPAEAVSKDIRRQTRKHYDAKEKLRIVLEGRAATTASPSFVAEKGWNKNLYYRWSKGLPGGWQEAAGGACHSIQFSGSRAGAVRPDRSG